MCKLKPKAVRFQTLNFQTFKLSNFHPFKLSYFYPMNPIPFNKAFVPESLDLSDEALKKYGEMDALARMLGEHCGQPRLLLTHSCTAALEMSALLAEIKPGDEIIMPSFTFVSSANAFALRGGVPVFIDIRPDTLNIDETKIEAAITPKTRAIVVMHYAGVGAEMVSIRAIAKKHALLLIEDAAHGFGASYGTEALGTMGDLGCMSFDVSKNIHCFKGGALLINNERFFERAQWLLEKGTNRSDFDAGKTEHYSWVDLGSNYGMSALNAVFLRTQMEQASEIGLQRMELWKRYYLNLNMVRNSLGFRIPEIPKACNHNAHIFYLICKDKSTRDALIAFLGSYGTTASFHYIPLHRSPAGQRLGRFHGKDVVTTQLSQTMLRLPLFHSLKLKEVDYICEKIIEFFNQ
jgi:dTDP-4-amino-4,6-dideoxygalactose transaminase